MKYGVKTTDNKVEGLIAVNELPAGFTEITKEKYDEGMALINQSKAIDYDGEAFTENATATSTLATAKDRADAYRKLRELSIKIDLETRLGNDVAALETEFATLKDQYQPPPA